MKTKRDFIKTISIMHGNLSHIESTGNINGTLLIEIERVMEEYAQQQVKNLNKPDISNELPDFRDVIKARIEYFKSIDHSYEASDLQIALNTIIGLVPPDNFRIGQ